MSRRLSVVLFNLGGPDSLGAVRGFLFNLFNDPAIISVRQPFRWLLAALIASVRAKTARAIYSQIGGASPLLAQTRAQADALTAVLQERLPDVEVQTVVAMRHWHPFTAEAARAVQAHQADDAVLLPLYPQFSGTTTGSSLSAWTRAYKGKADIRVLCCYPDQPGLVEAHAERILETAKQAGGLSSLRVMFSAHGLPEKTILEGDPYQQQVERTVSAVVERLGLSDWRVCYQSRVGPLKWIGPSTQEVLIEAGQDGVGVLVTPIAFVSEHSETLVELDIEYREFAAAAGVPVYLRAPAVGVEPAFIGGLADMVGWALQREGAGAVLPGASACPKGFSRCPLQGRGQGRQGMPA